MLGGDVSLRFWRRARGVRAQAYIRREGRARLALSLAMAWTRLFVLLPAAAWAGLDACVTDDVTGLDFAATLVRSNLGRLGGRCSLAGR